MCRGLPRSLLPLALSVWGPISNPPHLPWIIKVANQKPSKYIWLFLLRGSQVNIGTELKVSLGNVVFSFITSTTKK